MKFLHLLKRHSDNQSTGGESTPPQPPVSSSETTTRYGGSRSGASQLAGDINISKRVAEIAAPAVEKSKVTAEYLLERLCMEIEGEVEDTTQAGRVSAMRLASQLAGLLIERRENTCRIDPAIFAKRREEAKAAYLKLQPK